jgi:hypothetical protein
LNTSIALLLSLHAQVVGSSHIATTHTSSSPLEQSRDCANQILKAATAIGSGDHTTVQIQYRTTCDTLILRTTVQGYVSSQLWCEKKLWCV